MQGFSLGLHHNSCFLLQLCSQGCVDCQEPQLLLSSLCSSPLPVHLHHLPGRVQGAKGRETGHQPLQRRREKGEMEEEEEEEHSLMKKPEGYSPAGKRQGCGGCPGYPRVAQRSHTGQREAD